MKTLKKNNKGFTLIEILVVIGIIAILAVIVLVAINPARQFRQARDTQRTSNVNAILNAIGQYTADNKGDLPSDIPDNTPADISVALCNDLVPTYIPALPTDPSSYFNGEDVDNCDDLDPEWSDYEVVRDSTNGRITVSAPDAEIASDISVTR